MRPRARCAALALLASLLAGAFPGVARAASVWAVHGAKHTVYLAGSVHVLSPQDSGLPPAMERAYTAATGLIMEIDIGGADALAGQGYVLENGLLPEGETLRSVVGEQRYRRIEQESARVGLPLESLQQFEPWAVALTLTQLQLAKLGMDPDSGVERQLERRARADGKPMRGLETVEQQLAVLHGLSLEDQSRFLELTATEGSDLESETRAVVSAWRAGDSKSLERLLRSEYDEFPGLYGPLVTARNRRWVPQIVELLASDRDWLVVVGALHLVGHDGVIELLRRQGYEAKALD